MPYAITGMCFFDVPATYVESLLHRLYIHVIYVHDLTQSQYASIRVYTIQQSCDNAFHMCLVSCREPISEKSCRLYLFQTCCQRKKLPVYVFLFVPCQVCVETMMHLTCTNMQVEKLEQALAEVRRRIHCTVAYVVCKVQHVVCTVFSGAMIADCHDA